MMRVNTECKPGSGKPRSVRKNDTFEDVKDMILTQEDRPGTHTASLPNLEMSWISAVGV